MPCSLCNSSDHYGHDYGECDRCRERRAQEAQYEARRQDMLDELSKTCKCKKLDWCYENHDKFDLDIEYGEVIAICKNCENEKTYPIATTKLKDLHYQILKELYDKAVLRKQKREAKKKQKKKK